MRSKKDFDTSDWKFTGPKDTDPVMSWKELLEKSKASTHAEHQQGKDGQGFAGSEHRAIGNAGFDKFLECEESEGFLESLGTHYDEFRIYSR